jgi:hypothetical protein
MNLCKLTSRAAFALCTAGLAPPSLAADTCAQWAFQGPLALRHSNGTVVNLTNGEQSGTRFTASGRYYPPPSSTAQGPFGSSILKHRDVNGHAVGTVVGNAFEATVYWGSSSIGVYSGQVGPQGQLTGHTRDKTDPTEESDFQSDRPLACAKGGLGSSSLGAMPASPAAASGPMRTAASTRPTAASGPLHAIAPVGARKVAHASKGHAAKLAASSAQASPTAAARRKADAVSLNPQPLPPSTLTPAQVPGALR